MALQEIKDDTVGFFLGFPEITMPRAFKEDQLGIPDPRCQNLGILRWDELVVCSGQDESGDSDLRQPVPCFETRHRLRLPLETHG